MRSRTTVAFQMTSSGTNHWTSICAATLRTQQGSSGNHNTRFREFVLSENTDAVVFDVPHKREYDERDAYEMSTWKFREQYFFVFQFYASTTRAHVLAVVDVTMKAPRTKDVSNETPIKQKSSYTFRSLNVQFIYIGAIIQL